MVDVPDSPLLRDLPTAHAVALRLDARGADHSEIAEVLGVPVASVTGLLEIARAKLAELTAAQQRADGER